MRSVIRNVIPWVGSDDYLPAARLGLEYLSKLSIKGRVSVPMVVSSSIHRNGANVIDRLRRIADGSIHCDVLVIGAGMANHLTGTADAWLRNVLRDAHVPVIGVAFEGKTEEATLAAQLSISQVPGTQVIYGDEQGPFVGSEGFLRACRFAVDGILPVIEIPMPMPDKERYLAEVIGMFRRQ